MAVYVDRMKARFGSMVMCHMIADSRAELLEMADRIGVRRQWMQAPSTYREHFDISLTKRELAVDAGAIEISWRELGEKIRARRVGASTCP
jgi:hypothetical protein